MSGLFRSEEMCLCQLYLQRESAYMIIGELGELSITQFRDLNPKVNAYQRKYVGDVRRCEEMERKLYFIKNEMRKLDIVPTDLDTNPPAPKRGEISELESSIEKAYQQIRELSANSLALRKSHAQCVEMSHVLQWTDQFFSSGLVPSEADVMVNLNDDLDTTGATGNEAGDAEMQRNRTRGQSWSEAGVRAGVGPAGGGLSCLCGLINSEKVDSVERMLWRTSRGNIFFRWMDIGETDDPESEDKVQKCVYIMFFQGMALESKLKKICEAFHATVQPCPQDATVRREMATAINTQMQDMKTVLSQSKEHRYSVLLAASKKYNEWVTQVRKAKAIFHTLNLLNLDLTQKTLIAECWIPVRELDSVNAAISRGTTGSGATVRSIINRLDTNEDPPTYNRVNKFTGPWQSIIDAYGYGSYREVNPTLYTLVTFPFLFGVMYGDAGHGTIMTILSGLLCIFERKIASMKIRDDIFNTFYHGRYVLLSMGLFSIYTGSIYNEIFAKATNVFGSKWRVPYSNASLLQNPRLTLNPNSDAYFHYPYPYGFDPAWATATNKLNFQNSFKMKVSIILGVLQMLFGVLLSIVNYKYFQHYLEIFCDFIPQLLFLLCIFLYLVIMILYKWIAFGAGGAMMAVGYYPGSHCAPNLLVGLINMFMLKHRPEGFNGTACFTNAYYPQQNMVEIILVMVSLVCIPWMLFVKPIVLKYRHVQETKRLRQNEIAMTTFQATNGEHATNGDHQPTIGEQANDEELRTKAKASTAGTGAGSSGGGGGGAGHGRGESVVEFNLGETFITSAIHTVEYCLGLVSHTASYLRLWALSLAHSELSDVLWTMVMRNAFKSSSYTGAVAVYLIFFAFGSLTIAILIFMDSLSVFLHALRLHWVEFQSKFYSGLGYGFEPFSFKEILALGEQQDHEREQERSL